MLNRREFIKKMSRNLIVGGIVAGGGYLLLKPETGKSCDFDFICKDCRQLKDCKLPEANNYKKDSKANK